MLRNTDITLINSYGGKVYPTLIRGVQWTGRCEITVAKEGEKSADAFTIRIFVSSCKKEYMEPHLWDKMPEERRKKYWTLKKNDLILKECVKSIPDKLTDILRSNPTAVSIVGITDNRIGSPFIQHWRVTAK